MTAEQLPVLDDRSFDDLVREALALLPAHAPAWTNHNPSDPGITLIELFAYFTEILLYRLSRIPLASKQAFLRLLTGDASAAEGAAAADITQALRAAVRELAQLDCAVTAPDYQRLARAAAQAHWQAHGMEAEPLRVLCLPSTNLEPPGLDGMGHADRSHVSVVLVPGRTRDADALAALCAAVRRALQARCLLTTRLHVGGPLWLRIGIGVVLAARPGTDQDGLRDRIAAALARDLAPAPDGDEDDGVPLAERPLYLGDIAAAIDRVDGVEAVLEVDLLQLGVGLDALTRADSSVGIQIGAHALVGQGTRLGQADPAGPTQRRLLRAPSGKFLGILLKPWEQARLALLDGALTIHDADDGPGGHHG